MTLRRLTIYISLLLAAAAFAAQSKMAAAPRVQFIPWEEAAPIVSAAPAGTLPPELAGKQPQQVMDLWPDWVRAEDKQVRERLAKGDEDSLVNLLLFGTSYTRQPRLSADFFEKLRASGAKDSNARLEQVIGGRTRDLVIAMGAARRNERVDFARRLVLAK